jgi:hypothetical protein
MWVRDPNDPDDVEAAWAELRLAVERSIEEIGLDGWRFMPLWERYAFMKRMQENFPSLKFITEGNDPDIGHVLAPGYTGQRDGPPLLADWLNPGHESWVQLRPKEWIPEGLQKYIEWGLVPMTFVGIEHDASRIQNKR